MNTKELISAIGGQASIARECDISDAAVSQWVSFDEVPPARAQYLRLAHPGAHWEAYDAARAAKEPAKTEA